MELSDADLRVMVREAIAGLGPRGRTDVLTSPAEAGPPEFAHASHGRLPVSDGVESGACLIEPAVPCTHCGYCQSYGH